MLEYDHGLKRFNVPREGVTLKIEGNDYRILWLSDEDPKVGMNRNSWVFRALPLKFKQDGYQDEDQNDDYVAIKICLFSSENEDKKSCVRELRFFREIEAMRKVNRGDSHERVLCAYDDFKIGIAHKYQGFADVMKTHVGYIMEYADSDLEKFLKKEINIIPFSQRVLLCFDVLRSLQWLHTHGVYHRDIKPANFFMVDRKCKIGDLGLVSFRDDDQNLDGRNERIGPDAFLTPEAINKKYSIRNDMIWSVGEKSDVCQIVKLIWFILQFDIPNGIIRNTDFVVQPDLANDLFGNVFKPALQYNENSRPSVRQVSESFERVMHRYLQ
jgi:serine/threonine protein kinase